MTEVDLKQEIVEINGMTVMELAELLLYARNVARWCSAIGSLGGKAWGLNDVLRLKSMIEEATGREVEALREVSTHEYRPGEVNWRKERT